MLAQIRQFAKSPIALGILGLLLLSFVVFGIGDVFKNGAIKDAVVQAGGRSVGAAQFKLRFDQFRKQVEQQQNNGQPMTVEQAAAAGLDKALVEQLAYSESLAALFEKIGLQPSDKLVIQELRKQPSFFDPVTGRFDRATYQQRLQQVGMSETEFETELRDQIAQQHFVSGLAAGLTVPRTYVAALAAYAREGRDFTWFTLAPQLAGPPVQPTDAQLLAYIKANAAQYTKPELRQFSMVRFSPALMAATVKVDEAEVQKRFAFEKDSLSVPETRSFAQVPVKDAAAGAQAVARLRAGETPEPVAKALGVSPISYQDAPKTAVTDRRVADAAFAMKAGEVGGPVQGALGLQVVKVTKVSPGHQATIEEARPKIEAELRKDAATEKAYELVQKYEDAHSGGATLAEAAKKAGAEVVAVPVPLTAQGTDLAGRASGAPPKLMEAIFALGPNGESDVLDLGQGEYVAVRLDKIMPSAVAGLDEVRTAATRNYVLQDLDRKLKARADEITARIKKGETLAQAAQSVGASAQTATSVMREGAQRNQQFSQDLLAKVFAAKPNDIVVAQDVRLGYVVAKLDKVVSGTPAELAPLVEQQQSNFRNALFQDVAQTARNAARDEIKPKVDYNRARTAIGLEAQAPAPAAKAAPGQKK
jgi:peptidyl-prolyl cis-trans isomerase D